MVAHYVRRLVGGATMFLLASFALYATMILAPGGVVDQQRSVAQPAGIDYPIDYYAITFYTHRPWPQNYLLWLLDPHNAMELNSQNVAVPIGINLRIGSLHLAGSGALTGDFGHSAKLDRGVPVRELIGDPGPLLWPLSIGTLLLMAITILQRRGRRAVWRRVAPPTQDEVLKEAAAASRYLRM